MYLTKTRPSWVKYSPLKCDWADQITTMKKQDGNFVI